MQDTASTLPMGRRDKHLDYGGEVSPVEAGKGEETGAARRGKAKGCSAQLFLEHALQGRSIARSLAHSLTHSRYVVQGDRAQSSDKVSRRQAGSTTAAAAGERSSKFFPSPAG